MVFVNHKKNCIKMAKLLLRGTGSIPGQGDKGESSMTMCNSSDGLKIPCVGTAVADGRVTF